MNTVAMVLSLAGLTLIGALPRLFFRPGRFNLGWWITASPFFLTAATLIAGMVGVLDPLAPALPTAEPVSVLLSAMSILLVGFTLDSHREPVSLWHQDEQAPRDIVTRGAYARIRHPFYAAFLVALLAATLAFPHWITIGCLIFAGVQLNRTAAGEEQRILISSSGREYAAYRERTGRFFPRIGIRRRATA
jgi:protein-S-isoprenylcysteine O-methyltransferase Ste14